MGVKLEKATRFYKLSKLGMSVRFTLPAPKSGCWPVFCGVYLELEARGEEEPDGGADEGTEGDDEED